MINNKEIIISFFIIIMYILLDFQNQQSQIYYGYNSDNNHTQLIIPNRYTLKNNEIITLDKNVWGLSVDNSMISLRKTEDSRYELKDNNKTICFNQKCLEFIAIIDNNQTVFFNTNSNKFKTIKINDIIFKNLKLISINKYIVLKNTNKTYKLNRGFIDIDKYRRKNVQN